MINPILCVLVFVPLGCCGSSQAQCPPDQHLCTTQPLNIKLGSSTTDNNILYRKPFNKTGNTPGSVPYVGVFVQEEQNAGDILWIARFDTGTNSYKFAYRYDPLYFLCSQETNGVTVPMVCWEHTSTSPSNNLKWTLELTADSSCETYAMKNVDSGTYLQFDPVGNVVLAPTTEISDQGWTFPGSSCSITV